MDSPTIYLLAADAVLLLHAFFVAFVVIGLLLIIAGKIRAWSWVRNPWFRLGHLVAITVVIIQSWFSVICPLTSIEMALRSRAGDSVYHGSFIAYWLDYLLYYQLPTWVFVVSYTIFGFLVVISWFYIRPRRFKVHKS